MAKKRKKRINKEERKRLENRKQKQRNNLSVLILIVVALFFALSVYFGIEQLGWLADFGKGLLGAGIYLLPIALIYIAVNLIRPNEKVSTTQKIISASGILLIVGMAFYLFCEGKYTESVNLSVMWKGSVELACGGVLPGLIAVPLIMVISRWGLGIILVAILLFCVLAVTNCTLYEMFCWIRDRLRPKAQEKEEKTSEPVPERVDVPLPSAPAVYPIENTVDISIDAYEVPDDELDADGQPLYPTPEETIDIPAPPEAVGTALFAYDVDPEQNVDPADIVDMESSAVKEEEIAVESEPPEEKYVFPPLSLLQKPKFSSGTAQDEVEYNSKKLLETLRDFGVEAKMLGASVGPNVTRYELQPKAGTKVSKITGLSDDIALSLAATQVRIEAPIPGKAAVGIEIPNQAGSTVYIRDLLDSEDFAQAKSPLTVALGKDISGKNIYADLSKMPHLLIAGSTGSGKSVCINTILMSLLYKSSPKDVKLILIDPKVVELSIYNKIPHLFIPVVTDPKKAAGALHWACSEMDRRYNLFTEFSVRDMNSYNEAVLQRADDEHQPLPRIVVVIDELADLMMVASKEVEEHICRLCQKARAAGIFLILATQRPSADVVTGLIKANVPSRIAFAVSSQVDSRVIMDSNGAEKLLGRGDMLYRPIGANKARRIQGCFVSDDEVENVVDFIRNHVGEADYDDSAIQKIEEMSSRDGGKNAASSSDGEEEDEMLMPAIECVVEAGMASTSFLQRKLKLGYSRAARLVDLMEEMGIVGPFEGAKPRSVKMSLSELQEMKLKRGAKE